jgi:hypothetical protein
MQSADNKTRRFI